MTNFAIQLKEDGQAVTKLKAKVEAMEGSDSIVVERDEDIAGLLTNLSRELKEPISVEWIENGPRRWAAKLTKPKKEGCCGCCG